VITEEGAHKGLLKVAIGISPFINKTIIVNPVHVRSVVSLTGDDLGDKDREGNVIHVSEYIDEDGKVVKADTIYTVPADAFRDK
jgi:hypothetical protein